MKSEIILKNERDIIEREELDFNYLINRYLEFIDVSQNSLDTYTRALRQFFKYIVINNITNPKREDIIEYREYLKENHSPKTVNLYLVSVKNFYKWLEYEEITKDITKNIKSLKLESEHLRDSFTVEEINQILDNCKDLREKLIITLPFVCGIRINELVNIRIRDFQTKNGVKVLYLLGKGRDFKEDFVIIPDNIYNLILEYVNENNITDYLFVSTSPHNNGGKLTTKTIRYISNNIFKKCGLKDDMHSFHSLRHSFANESIKSGLDIREVSQALRHKNISTTSIYLHDLEKINNKCSNNVSCLINV